MATTGQNTIQAAYTIAGVARLHTHIKFFLLKVPSRPKPSVFQSLLKVFRQNPCIGDKTSKICIGCVRCASKNQTHSPQFCQAVDCEPLKYGRNSPRFYVFCTLLPYWESLVSTPVVIIMQLCYPGSNDTQKTPGLCQAQKRASPSNVNGRI